MRSSLRVLPLQSMNVFGSTLFAYAAGGGVGRHPCTPAHIITQNVCVGT